MLKFKKKSVAERLNRPSSLRAFIFNIPEVPVIIQKNPGLSTLLCIIFLQFCSVVDEMSSYNLRTSHLKKVTLVDGGEEKRNSSKGCQHCWWVNGRNLQSAFITQAMGRTMHSVSRRYPIQTSAVLTTTWLRIFVVFFSLFVEMLRYYRTYTAPDSFHLFI